MFQTVENSVELEKSSLTTLSRELEVSCSMLRFWQEEFGIGQKIGVNLSESDMEELRLVARWSKIHQFRLELVHNDLENHRKRRAEKQKIVEKMQDLRNFLQKIQQHL